MARDVALGGVAVTVVGRCGDGVRGDCEVTVESASSLAIEVRSLVGELFGDRIRAQVERVLAAFGNPGVRLLLRDAGALPFAIEARLEAALATHLGVDLPSIQHRTPIVVPQRLRRTRLYVPGDGPKLIPNAMLYGADTILLDLEDSVAPSAKASARAMVRRALASLDWGDADVAVRINAGELGREDIRAVAMAVDTIVVPKAEEPEELAWLAAMLDDMGAPAQLVPIIESAKGVLKAYEIAASTPRIAAVALGLEDLTADLGVSRTVEGKETAWARGAFVAGCRAAGVSPLNSVISVIDDADAVERYARESAAMGFEGIGCIHPGQVTPAHRGFAPDAKEVERARRLVTQYEEALSSGKGAIAFEGGMVDVPVYERARRTLKRAGGVP